MKLVGFLLKIGNNTYQFASNVEFVEFGKKTLALLVYFSILTVANHIITLGVQTADGRRQTVTDKVRTNPLPSIVYFITNTYQLTLLVKFFLLIYFSSNTYQLYFLVKIRKTQACFTRIVWYKYTSFSCVVFHSGCSQLYGIFRLAVRRQ